MLSLKEVNVAQYTATKHISKSVLLLFVITFSITRLLQQYVLYNKICLYRSFSLQSIHSDKTQQLT